MWFQAQAWTLLQLVVIRTHLQAQCTHPLVLRTRGLIPQVRTQQVHIQMVHTPLALTLLVRTRPRGIPQLFMGKALQWEVMVTPDLLNLATRLNILMAAVTLQFCLQNRKNLFLPILKNIRDFVFVRSWLIFYRRRLFNFLVWRFLPL